MEKRELGTTGIEMSVLGWGTVKIGRNTQVKYPGGDGFELPDMAACADLLSLARELGINTLDTAPSYGLSEERLGILLEGQRDDWVIVGKAGEEYDGKSHYDFSPQAITESVERSLSRLKTDYIDVLLVHANYPDGDILNDDVLEALCGLRDAGKCRAVGMSSTSIEGGLKSIEHLDTAMVTYHPDPEFPSERPVIDRAVELGKGVLAKKIFKSGHDAIKPGGVEQALRFVFAQQAVTSAIVGTITPENLRNNVEIVNRILAEGPVAAMR